MCTVHIRVLVVKGLCHRVHWGLGLWFIGSLCVYTRKESPPERSVLAADRWRLIPGKWAELRRVGGINRISTQMAESQELSSVISFDPTLPTQDRHAVYAPCSLAAIDIALPQFGKRCSGPWFPGRLLVENVLLKTDFAYYMYQLLLPLFSQ